MKAFLFGFISIVLLAVSACGQTITPTKIGTPTRPAISTPTPKPFGIDIEACQNLTEPEPVFAKIVPGPGIMINEVYWDADRGSFENPNSISTNYFPGTPGPVVITVTVRFMDSQTTIAVENCVITDSKYTASPNPIPSPTVTYTPITPTTTHTDTVTPTPTASITPTFTPSAEPVLIEDCFNKFDWQVSASLSNSINVIDDKCLDLSKLNMAASSSGFSVNFDNITEQRLTYNLYSDKSLIAPQKIRFTLIVNQMEALPDAGEDISIYAGFVNERDGEPDWISAVYEEGNQGTFIVFRLAGTSVKANGNSKTRYLLIDDNPRDLIGADLSNVHEKFVGYYQQVDIELHYRESSVIFYWRPNSSKSWSSVSISNRPNPAFFVIGYSMPGYVKPNSVSSEEKRRYRSSVEFSITNFVLESGSD